jgi:hypothetical protein
VKQSKKNARNLYGRSCVGYGAGGDWLYLELLSKDHTAKETDRLLFCKVLTMVYLYQIPYIYGHAPLSNVKVKS